MNPFWKLDYQGYNICPNKENLRFELGPPPILPLKSIRFIVEKILETIRSMYRRQIRQAEVKIITQTQFFEPNSGQNWPNLVDFL